MNILVSACLLGKPCRYDGKSKPNEKVLALAKKHRLIPVCPEVAGGLKIPRTPCERVGDKVLSKDGEDRTGEYLKGAQIALKLCKRFNCDCAVLKERSPSCAAYEIYDGSFCKKLINGKGTAAELLLKNNIKVVGESHLEEIL